MRDDLARRRQCLNGQAERLELFAAALLSVDQSEHCNRDRYDGVGMFNRFREELVLPHMAALRRLSPLSYSSLPGTKRVLDS